MRYCIGVNTIINGKLTEADLFYNNDTKIFANIDSTKHSSTRKYGYRLVTFDNPLDAQIKSIETAKDLRQWFAKQSKKNNIKKEDLKVFVKRIDTPNSVFNLEKDFEEFIEDGINIKLYYSK